MQQLEAWAAAHPWSWLFTGAWALLTFALGLRVQWREIERLLGGGGIRENTREQHHEMLGAGDEKPVPRQDPEDGLWYVPTFDPSTGQRNGKRVVDAPNLRAPVVRNQAKLGWFRS